MIAIVAARAASVILPRVITPLATQSGRLFVTAATCAGRTLMTSTRCLKQSSVGIEHATVTQLKREEKGDFLVRKMSEHQNGNGEKETQKRIEPLTVIRETNSATHQWQMRQFTLLKVNNSLEFSVNFLPFFFDFHIKF